MHKRTQLSECCSECVISFFLFISDDSSVPILLHIPGLRRHMCWQHTQTQQSAVQPTAAWWLTWLRLALVGTWSWKKMGINCHLELSVSPQRLSPYCSGKLFRRSQAAWQRRLLGLDASCSTTTRHEPSAPSSFVFIVSDSGAGAAEIGSGTINSTPTRCLYLLV